MAEVSGIFPNMVGALEPSGSKTATEINTKTQGQMTRLAMIVDTINQDLIIPNVEKVAKLCADFKSGIETIFVDHDNKQEYIEIDDFVRQGDYKYTYADANSTLLKSEQADLVVSAVEKFAKVIPLNLEEIFVWYFEQKGVDNPERFLMETNNNPASPSPLEGEGRGEGLIGNNQSLPSPVLTDTISNQTDAMGEENGLNHENPINQIMKLISQSKKKLDITDVVSKLRNKKFRKDK